MVDVEGETEPAFGPLGELAHFFTSFGAYFCGSDIAPNTQLTRPISVEQMRKALEHQVHLQNRAKLQFFILKQQRQRRSTNDTGDNNHDDDGDGDHGNENQNDLARQLQTVNEAIDNIPPLTKLVHRMWKRFLIWNTQDLAHCIFFSNTQHCAPLLNFPATLRHAPALPKPTTRWKLPRDEDKGPSVSSSRGQTLISQPNNWTWQEWLRWSRMATRVAASSRSTSTIRRRRQQQLQTSPLSNCTLTKLAKFNPNAPVSQTDIVALWLRAQRNTEGYLNLIRMFELELRTKPEPRAFRIRGAKARGGGKQVVEATADDGDDGTENTSEENLHYVAKFLGMPSNPCHHREAPLLEKLVEWAVINQLLFTVPFLKKAIQDDGVFLEPCALSFQKSQLDKGTPMQSSKRPRIAKDTPGHKSSSPVTTATTAPTIHPSSEQSETAVEAKVESWGTTPTQISDTEKRRFVLRWFVLRNRKVCNILCNGHRIDAPLYNGLACNLDRSEIRTQIKTKAKEQKVFRYFARLDRRLEHLTGETMKEQILKLLDILAECTVPAGLLRAKDIEDTKRDAAQLVGLYVQGSRPLIVGSTVKNARITLASIPAPWGTCGACKGRLGNGSTEGGGEIDFFKCNCCGHSFHHCCMGRQDDPEPLAELVKKFPPLRQVYCARVPQNFSDLGSHHNSMSWKEHVVKIPVRSDGRPNVGGLELNLVSRSKQLYRELLQGNVLVDELYDETRVKEMPFQVDIDGVVVVHVRQNLSANVRRGDIITHIKTGTMDKRKPLLNLTWQRVKTVMESTTQGDTTLWIRRARQELGDNSIMRRVRKLNRHLRRPFENTERLTVCGNCLGRESDGVVELSVADKALLARAIVRRLAIEACSTPFHEAESRNALVSFQRLDKMMEALASEIDVSGTFEKGERIDPAFYMLPSLPNKDPNLLSWITPSILNKPLHLLCAGMKELLSSPLLSDNDGCSDPHVEERAGLAVQFLTTFTSWHRNFLSCGSFRTLGPPKGSLDLFEPWINRQCRVCFARPSESPSGMFQTCGRDCCKRIIKEFLGMKSSVGQPNARTGGTGAKTGSVGAGQCDAGNSQENNKPSRRHALERHLHYSSHVGSTILAKPGDVLQLRVSACLRRQIDTCGRPMPFVVASYLPSQMSNIKRKNFAESDKVAHEHHDGFFHLLPLVDDDQITSLHRALSFRNIPNGELPNVKEWVDVEALDFDGVICVPARSLMRRVSHSKAMENAIDFTVGRMASSVSEEEHRQAKDGSVQTDLEKELVAEADCFQTIHTANNTTETSIWGLAHVSCDLLNELVSHGESRLHDLVQTVVTKEVSHDTQSYQPNVPVPEVVTDDDETVCHRRATANDGNCTSVNDPSGVTGTPKRGKKKSASAEEEPGPSNQETRDLQTPDPPLELAESDREGAHNGTGESQQTEENTVTLAAAPPHHPIASRDRVAEFDFTSSFNAYPQVAHQQQPSHPPRNAPRFLSIGDAFMFVGFRDVFLTRVEVAVVSELLDRSLPVLAVRVLCPRYAGRQAAAQVGIVARLKSVAQQRLPKVSGDFVTELVQADYERSKQETGSAAISEPDGRFSYRKPVIQLPIDTLYIRYLRGKTHLNLPPPFAAAPQRGYGEPRNAGPPNPPKNTSNFGNPFCDLVQDGHRTVGGPRASAGQPTAAAAAAAAMVHRPSRIRNRCLQPWNPRPQIGAATPAVTNQHHLGERMVWRNVSSRPGAEKDSLGVPVGELGSWDGTARIRGGGTPTRCLEDLEKTDFGMTLVSGKVSLCDDGEEEVASASPFIGYVENDQSQWEVDGDEMRVTVFILILFLEGKPQSLEDPVKVTENASRLELVLPGTEEARHFAAWKQDDKISNKPDGIKEPLQFGGQSRFGGGDGKDGADKDESLQGDNEGSGTGLFLKRLLHRGMPCLGSLPCGGLVVWLQIDPEALFIRRSNCSDHQQDALRTSVSSFPDKDTEIRKSSGGSLYSCDWGRKDQAQSEDSLSFPNVGSVLEQTEGDHSHNMSWSSVRIHGREIVRVAGDLVTALCEPHPPLKQFMVSPEKKAAKATFDLDKVGELFAQKNALIYQKGMAHTRHLLRLWYRIARLYNVHKDGQPRFSLSKYFTQCAEYVHRVDGVMRNDSETCFDDAESKEEIVVCGLCCNGMSSVRSHRGCAIISCENSTKHLGDAVTAPSTSLEYIKHLVLRFASKVPENMRKSVALEGSHLGLFGRTGLWDDQRYLSFCSLVLESENIETIGQCVAVLFASIDSTKMPSWWNDSGAGWLSLLKITTFPSAPRLLLYLYVLDVALSEVVCSKEASQRRASTKAPKSQSQVRSKFRKLVRIAEQAGLMPDKRKREGKCLHCKKGGSGILLCGFCGSAAHGRCCYPAIHNVDSIETWVCDDCSKDIQNLLSS